MKIAVISVVAVLILVIVVSCTLFQRDEMKLTNIIESHVKQIHPLVNAKNLADWNATATGEQKYYDEAAALELQIKKIQSNRKDFAFLKKLKAKNSINDPLLQRQLVILYNSFAPNQIDTSLLRSMVDKQNTISSIFNTFRGVINGKSVSDNDILEILKNERDSLKRRQAWEAGKQVGQQVAAMVVELVKLRNQAARQLGYDNYYVMALETGEQDEKTVFSIFDTLKELTQQPFTQMKHELDSILAKRYAIAAGQLRPWHYEDPFFQESPQVAGADFDKLFKGKKVEAIGRDFFNSIQLPADDILRNSDLYPREKKYQHAYENDMDRCGDIRVMLNIVDNHNWMSTLLHELGHGVYSKYVSRDLPYLLRIEAHTFLTEAIAMLMERQAYNADWLQTYLQIGDEEKETIRCHAQKNFRTKVLVFSRWSQVMVRFERDMYQNPDQDLNKLWWDLVEEYQLVTRPENRNEPDWAAKIHLAQYPCYYHNYTLGELAASQILNTITRTVMKMDSLAEISFVNKPEIGEYLKTEIFMPGSRFHWNALLKKATGEELTPKYLVGQFM